MTLEAWDERYKPNLDWNHAWGTAPVNIIARYMWGITPLKPGYTTVQIKPQLKSLTFSSINVPTIKGGIYADYKLKREGIHLYEINLPAGMDGKFVLPNVSEKVLFNEELIDARLKVLQLKSGLNKVAIYE